MPNRIRFTQAAVDNLAPPPAGRIIVWDNVLPGFGLRVAAPRPGSREGRKTWIAMYRVDGKAVMETIGTLAQIPKVEKAREAARGSIMKAKGGAHPVEERRAEKARRVAEAAAVEIAAVEAVEGRFAAVAERFLAEGKNKKGKRWSPKYAAEVRRILEHDIIPRWGGRPIRSIVKHDINELLDAKAGSRERARKGSQGGAGVQANRTLTRLRRMFAWAAAEDLVVADPTAGVAVRGHEAARDRVLTDDEIVAFWLGTERVGWPAGAILRLLLLTAQRESEVAGMRWSELDLDKRIWSLPRERTKSDRGHVVHLSNFAAEILEALPRLGDLVFPGRTGKPVSSFGKPKARLDALMAEQARAPIAPWVIHDLRRTATTVLAERLKVAPHVADKILNHQSGTIRGVAAIYNKAAYIDERKAALEALGRYIEGLVRPVPTNVVALARA